MLKHQTTSHSNLVSRLPTVFLTERYGIGPHNTLMDDDYDGKPTTKGMRERNNDEVYHEYGAKPARVLRSESDCGHERHLGGVRYDERVKTRRNSRGVMVVEHVRRLSTSISHALTNIKQRRQSASIDINEHHHDTLKDNSKINSNNNNNNNNSSSNNNNINNNKNNNSNNSSNNHNNNDNNNSKKTSRKKSNGNSSKNNDENPVTTASMLDSDQSLSSDVSDDKDEIAETGSQTNRSESENGVDVDVEDSVFEKEIECEDTFRKNSNLSCAKSPSIFSNNNNKISRNKNNEKVNTHALPFESIKKSLSFSYGDPDGIYHCRETPRLNARGQPRDRPTIESLINDCKAKEKSSSRLSLETLRKLKSLKFTNRSSFDNHTKSDKQVRNPDKRNTYPQQYCNSMVGGYGSVHGSESDYGSVYNHSVHGTIYEEEVVPELKNTKQNIPLWIQQSQLQQDSDAAGAISTGEPASGGYTSLVAHENEYAALRGHDTDEQSSSCTNTPSSSAMHSRKPSAMAFHMTPSTSSSHMQDSRKQSAYFHITPSTSRHDFNDNQSYAGTEMTSSYFDEEEQDEDEMLNEALQNRARERADTWSAVQGRRSLRSKLSGYKISAKCTFRS